MSKGVTWLGMVIVLVVAVFAAACGSTPTSGATLTVSTEPTSTTVSTEATSTTVSTEVSSTTVSTVGSTSTTPTTVSSTTVGPTSSTVTTGPAETTATAQTTATTVAGLLAYQTQMTAWYNKYPNNAKFRASLEAISTIQSPLEVTPEDIQTAQDFDTQVQAIVGALKKVKPPSQLATVHADYLQAWQGMATGADLMLQALKAGGAPEINEAFLTLESSEEQIIQTQSTLESAVGVPLFSTSET